VSDSNTGAESLRLAHAIRAITEREVFRDARSGVSVYDVTTRSALYQSRALEMFAAASTTKILTSVYALELLGCEFRFRTCLMRCGHVDDAGTLRGNLLLQASGDPNLSGRVTSKDTLEFRNLDSNSGPAAQLIERNPLQVIEGFARAVHAAGIRRVTGTVLIDVSLFAEGPCDLGSSAPISPVAVNDNQIQLEVKAGSRAGDPLSYRFIPRSGYVRFIDRATTGENGSEPELTFSSERLEADGTWSVTINGAVPPDSTSIAAFAVQSPSRFARTLLVEALSAVGVVIEGGLFGTSSTLNVVSADAVLVAQHVSPPLSEAIKVVLKVSQNLHAQMLIPVIGATVRGARGSESIEAGYACGADLLARWSVDMTGACQCDASGAHGYFSPDFMCRLLVRIASSDGYEAFLQGLPVMGVDGTLWDIQPNSPAAGRVAAKTGTIWLQDRLNKAILFTSKALAGYVTAKSGRRIAFAIYLNNFLRATSSDLNPGQVLGEMATAIYENL